MHVRSVKMWTCTGMTYLTERRTGYSIMQRTTQWPRAPPTAVHRPIDKCRTPTLKCLLTLILCIIHCQVSILVVMLTDLRHRQVSQSPIRGELTNIANWPFHIGTSSDVKFHEFFGVKYFTKYFGKNISEIFKKKFHDAGWRTMMGAGCVVHCNKEVNQLKVSICCYARTALWVSYTLIMFLKVLSHFIMEIKNFVIYFK